MGVYDVLCWIWEHNRLCWLTENVFALQYCALRTTVLWCPVCPAVHLVLTLASRANPRKGSFTEPSAPANQQNFFILHHGTTQELLICNNVETT
jgi:hypothetical protein